jgi:hypothetical protein
MAFNDEYHTYFSAASSARCFKQVWMVGKVGKVSKVGKGDKLGKVCKVDREGR